MRLFSLRRNKGGAIRRPDNSRYRYGDGGSLETVPGYHPHSSTRFANWDQASDSLRVKLPELYSRREECCGCTACAWACPKGAVGMEPDEEGFLYPVVDAALCVGCGKCLDACAFKG